ncbi:MAG: guanylate kinase [Chloroflexi bacterium]|nr:MAG: guanylate kinase [Chloroflexota bacterium]
MAPHRPFAACRRAHLHRPARSRARRLPARARRAGHSHAGPGGGSLSVDGRGLLVIISAPSGAGKDTVIHRLVKELDDAVVYVTATSRKPRRNEHHGVDYYFYEPEKFRAEIEAGNFLEWSMVHGDFKGVRKDALADTLRDHRIVIVKPEPQGMRKIKAKLPEALTIFIMPPSLESLRRRLVDRGTESDEQRDLRMRNAEIEMAAAPEYDYVVVNDDGKIDETVKEIAEIVRKEMKKPRHYDL